MLSICAIQTENPGVKGLVKEARIKIYKYIYVCVKNLLVTQDRTGNPVPVGLKSIFFVEDLKKWEMWQGLHLTFAL